MAELKDLLSESIKEQKGAREDIHEIKLDLSKLYGKVGSLEKSLQDANLPEMLKTIQEHHIVIFGANNKSGGIYTELEILKDKQTENERRDENRDERINKLEREFEKRIFLLKGAYGFFLALAGLLGFLASFAKDYFLSRP